MLHTLNNGDWQQQRTSFDRRVPVYELIKCGNVVYLDQEIPSVDEHGNASPCNQSDLENSSYLELEIVH